MAEISQGEDGFLLSSSQLSWAAASALLVACPGILYTNYNGTATSIACPGILYTNYNGTATSSLSWYIIH